MIRPTEAPAVPKRTWLQRFFGYDAAETSTRRKAAADRVKTADDLVTESKRRRLVESSRDIARNFAAAAWMIRRHLDYVTSFAFRPQTGNDAVNDALAELMAGYADKCDAAGRRDLPTFLRLAETCRTVDGDVFLLKLKTGKLQPIEGDRVRNPEGENAPRGELPPRTYHGIQVDAAGKPLRYAIHERNKYGQYNFQRWVPAVNVFPIGYFETFDQIRGISPLAQAINPLRDLYESFEYALGKMKVSQLFGLSIFREAGGDVGPLVADTEDDEPGDETEVEEPTDASRYQVDFGKGPIKLELDAGDRAEFLETQSPSMEFQQFSDALIGVALKALDIPLSFWNESFTNFYGSRAAAQQYGRACQHKQADLRRILNAVTIWRVVDWIRSGELWLPANFAFDDIRFEWIHEGMPWWKPLEETKADVEAIRAGFTTHDAIIRKRLGKGFRETVDDLADEFAYADQAGVKLSTATPDGAPPDEAEEPTAPGPKRPGAEDNDD